MRITIIMISIITVSMALLWGGFQYMTRPISTDAPHPAYTDKPKETITLGRKILAQENPLLLARIASGGAFGGKWSRLAATQMLSRDARISDAIRDKTDIQKIAEHVWLIRLPIVNVGVIETANSLVLIDSGYAAAGPVIKEKLQQISDKPVSHILISHYHIDHAWGAWAFMQDNPRPIIIGHERLADNLRRHIHYAGPLSHYNNQPRKFYPTSEADLTLPDQSFTDEMVLDIGDETLHLFAARGETDDQFYVWLPERNVLFTADYYQGFLPNAGNGKRVQRHLDEWANAMRHMASLKPAHLVPMHGGAISDPKQINHVLNLHADVLSHIVDYVRDELNDYKRHDRIISDYQWPEKFATEPSLATPYVRPKELVRMELKRQKGWWDDIPSHYYALPFEKEAAEILYLAGGIDALLARGRALGATDPPMAAKIADWAIYAAPDHLAAHEFAVETYIARMLDRTTPTQELLVYFDAAAFSRQRIEEIKSHPQP